MSLKIRSYTAFIIGLLVIPAVLLSVWTALGFIVLLSLLAAREWASINNYSTRSKYIFIFLIFGLIGLSLAVSWHPSNLTKLSIAGMLVLCVLAGVHLTHGFRKEFHFVSGILYIGLSAFFSTAFLYHNFDITKWYFLFLLILNWAVDIFAYLTGRKFGKTKIAPHISPGKSWEGLIGGTLFACLLGLVLNNFFFQYAAWKIILLALFIGIFGLFGDLLASSLKRHYQLKDSGSSIPGHGGFLDRFDSYFYITVVGICLYYLFNFAT